MSKRTDAKFSDTLLGDASTGHLKFVRDFWSVLEIKFLFLMRGWYWYLIRPLVFPLGVLFWLRVILPEDADINLRILAGAIVFGVSLSTANLLAQQILQDRFLGRLKLLITMPMSKVSYAAGVVVFASLQTLPIVLVLLACAPFVGVDLSLTWTILPMALACLLGLSGIGLFIGSYAPSLEVGGIMSNIAGVVLVMVSPVFFTMDQAPFALKMIGWVSPMRYAADGVSKSISGNADVWLEFAVMASFAFATLALGLWKLHWRES